MNFNLFKNSLIKFRIQTKNKLSYHRLMELWLLVAIKPCIH